MKFRHKLIHILINFLLNKKEKACLTTGINIAYEDYESGIYDKQIVDIIWWVFQF